MKNMKTDCMWNETERLAALDRYSILDTPPEQPFDDVVQMVAQLLEAPIAAINLIAEGRQWFKSEIGLGVREMPLDDSICAVAILQSGGMVVPDTTKDARFNCNPLVTGAPGLRFYAGELLLTPDGYPLGTLCVLDTKPRPEGLTPQQRFILKTLTQQVMSQIELRRVVIKQTQMLEEQRRIEEELRAERDQSRRLLDGMDEGFLFMDREFRIRQINACGMRMEQRPAAEIVGRSFWEAWPGSEDLPLATAYKKAMSDRVSVDLEQLYVFPDGRNVWLDIRAHPANDGLAVFYRDITEKKKAEQALREAERQIRSSHDYLRLLINCTDEAFYSIDSKGVTTLCNTAFLRMLGFEKEADAVGKSLHFLIHHSHPDGSHYELNDCPIYRAARDGVPAYVENEFFYRVDGTRFPVEYRVQPVWRDGQLDGAVCTFVDLTSHKQTENALRKSERNALEAAQQAENERRRLDALLEAAPVGMIVAGADGALLRVNRANRQIWGESHPFSRNVEEYSDWKGWWADGSEKQGQLLQPHDWAIARALRGEDITGDIIEIESFDTPPVRRIILNSGAPIVGADDEVVGAVVAQMDITARVKAEEALRQADRRKDEFLAMLAHELRNPLAPISAAAELMGMTQFNQDRVKQTSEVIIRQVRHMTGLIDDLLDVSRVTRGLVTLTKTPQDIKVIVSNAIEQVRPLIEARRHYLAINITPEPAQVSGDAKRLVQILTNLLNNAAKYTPEGGNLQLHTKVLDDRVILTVQDNGIGIAPELQPHIFELFAQAQRTSDRSQGGLGIGLALVRSLAELHDGTVECFSEGLGKGSRFTVCLPRINHQETSASPQTKWDLQKSSKPLRILVVDDNADAANMMALLLEEMGHDVAIEHDPRRALERAKIEIPDLCILDIGLPEMNGNELARHLRQQPQTLNSTLIAVTGYGQEQDKRIALAAGFNHHLVKPVDGLKLAALIAEIAHS